MSLLPEIPKFRTLGTSGISISSIAWGMWRFAEGGRSIVDAAALVHAALDAGITLLDTADIYGFDGSAGFGDAEALLGQVLAAEPVAARDRMVLATKGGILPPLPYDQSTAYLADAIDTSLRRLNVDHIDLWQVTGPIFWRIRTKWRARSTMQCRRARSALWGFPIFPSRRLIR